MAASQAAGGAGAAVSGDRIEIRPCVEPQQLQPCVEMQRTVWQFGDADVMPLRLFVVAEKVGGKTLGAYDGDRMVGFVMGIPGVRGSRPYLHSHMLAVLKEYRDHGIGRRLKLAQREDALRRGFELIEWTFDPLEIKNAFLNLERLGAIVRRYSVNHYGESSSPLQGGLPTDRFVAEWWLRSRRVKVLLEEGSHPPVRAEEKVEVPGDIYAWKASEADRPRAREVQRRNRERFLSAFARGLAILGMERDSQGNGTFLLGRWDEDWSYTAAAGSSPSPPQLARH